MASKLLITTVRNGLLRRVTSALSPVITVDRTRAQPLHRQIYEAFCTAIVSGNLGPGQRVPSTRELAVELRTSRIPVLNAYAQLLAEGYFESRKGAGTFICASLPDQHASSERSEGSFQNGNTGGRSVARRASLVSAYEPLPWLRGSSAFCLSHSAFDQFPFQIWSRLVMRHCRGLRTRDMAYGSPLGLAALRQAICAYLGTARAVRCDPGQVMIVNGSQQALEISTRVLLEERNQVWVEQPGYWLTRRVLDMAGCRLVPVSVDQEGLQVEEGIKRARKAKAAFVAPSHHYPLGVTMSASRRFQLLEWAESSGSWIIEDDYDSEYRYGSMPIASLQGLDHNSRVIYIGTFSKILFPSLRIGYLVIPPDLVEKFVAVRFGMDIGPPPFFQSVLADFMREGHFARHIRRMRQLYGQRRKALVNALEKEFASQVQIIGAEAGMYLAVLLPHGVSDREVAERAAQEGLWVQPLSPAYLGETRKQGLVLGFGSTPAEEMPKAVRRLKSLLDARYESAGDPGKSSRFAYCCTPPA
jgi:GntR family transcriptional regulator / MocR family aminotransferase